MIFAQVVPRLTCLKYINMCHFVIAIMIYNQANALKIPDG